MNSSCTGTLRTFEYHKRFLFVTCAPPHTYNCMRHAHICALACQVLQVDPSPQCEGVFQLFDYERSGQIDVREFMISLANFSGATKVSATADVFPGCGMAS
jgi:hypothetical protein